MTMKEGKSLLVATQHAMVAAQSQHIIDEASHCAGCGAPLNVKDRRQIVYRTLFGKVRLSRPRLSACSCQLAHDRLTFSPLAKVLKNRSHPELLYLTTRWASQTHFNSATFVSAGGRLDDFQPCNIAAQPHKLHEGATLPIVQAIMT